MTVQPDEQLAAWALLRAQLDDDEAIYKALSEAEYMVPALTGLALALLRIVGQHHGVTERELLDRMTTRAVYDMGRTG